MRCEVNYAYTLSPQTEKHFGLVGYLPSRRLVPYVNLGQPASVADVTTVDRSPAPGAPAELGIEVQRFEHDIANTTTRSLSQRDRKAVAGRPECL
jgi:hypothetical protein